MASFISATSIVLVLAVQCSDGALRTIPQRSSFGECEEASSFSTSKSYFKSDVRVAELPSVLVSRVESDIDAAKLISITYGQHFKVLTERMSKEQYVLTQCGTPRPSDAEVDVVARLGEGFQRKHFTIPLQQVIADSTVQLSFLRRLGVEDRISYVDQYATGPCFQKALACGAIQEDKWGSNATLRTAQLNSVEAVFMSCSPSDCDNVRARPNAVHFSTVHDNGNLHNAEHIKFVAAFFNLENKASDLFDNVVARYTAAKVVGLQEPIVAWVGFNAGNPAWGTVDTFTLAQASYRVQMTNAAGGSNVDGAAVKERFGDNMSETLAVAANPGAGKVYTVKASDFDDKLLAAREFVEALRDVDVVVDETYAAVPSNYGFDDFLTNFGLSEVSEFKFVKHKMVLRVDGTISSANGLDWYESRVAFPDFAVEGMARALHNDSSKRWMYFRNVALGEMPQVIFPDMCTKSLPSCVDGAYPEVLKMISDDASTTSLTKEETHSSNAVPLWTGAFNAIALGWLLAVV